MAHSKTSEDLDVLIDLNDFKSIRIHLTYLNNVTQTEISENSRKLGNKTEKLKPGEILRFLEIVEDGLIIEIPGNSGAVGHNVSITLKTENTDPIIKMSASAKIEESERLDSGNAQMKLKLLQHDEEAWDQFKKIFSSRQKEILDFFEAAKG